MLPDVAFLAGDDSGSIVLYLSHQLKIPVKLGKGVSHVSGSYQVLSVHATAGAVKHPVIFGQLFNGLATLLHLCFEMSFRKSSFSGFKLFVLGSQIGELLLV